MLEKSFLNWYDELAANCRELGQLDETLFPSSTAQDESESSSKSSFYRSLESEEERNRYSLLESYNPSRISDYVIKGRAYKSFKKYLLFEYAASWRCNRRLFVICLVVCKLRTGGARFMNDVDIKVDERGVLLKRFI